MPSLNFDPPRAKVGNVTLSEVSADGAQGAVSTNVMRALMVGEDQNVLNPSRYIVASK